MPVIFIKDGLCLTTKDLGSGWLGDLYQYRRGREGWGTNSTEQKFISCINTSYVQVYLVYSTAYNPLLICIKVIFDSLSISIMNIYVFLSRDRITRKIWRFKHTRYCSTDLNKQVSQINKQPAPLKLCTIRNISIKHTISINYRHGSCSSPLSLIEITMKVGRRQCILLVTLSL